MSWINLLYETYNNLEQAEEDQRRDLLPVAHSTQKAHIEITIDVEGNFIDADFVPDKVGKGSNLSETVIPVTESSANRTSGSAPHPLADKLKYLASDYEVYTGEKNEKNFSDYLKQLEQWKNSEYSTPKIEAVYRYVSQSPIVQQLVEHNIFSLNEEGKLTDKWGKAEEIKLSVGKQADAFIRFRVLDGSTTPNTWQDRILQKKYAAYYISTLKNQNLCYVQGKVTGISENHPSKIRNSGDKAKLISSNDTSGFTYRGRFQEGSDAVQISYEVSQKFHNALKFLIKKQGQVIGEKVFLLWGTKNELVPKLNTDSQDFCDEEDEEDRSEFGETLKQSAENFKKAILGYKSQINHDTKYAIIALDAATTGRLSVIYYREYHGEEALDLLDRMENWHQTAAWLQRYKFREKQMIPFYGAPSPYDIALCTFGTEQNGFIKGNNKVIAQTVERILPCISDSVKIPRDIVSALVRRCYSPEKYGKNNWLKILSVTCAMYKKYLYDYENEVIEMSTNNSSLSFNCGRLLAVADALENYAQKEKGITHTTSAMRYFNSFSHNPCHIWPIIMNRLSPYIASLGPKADYLQKLLGEISIEINEKEFETARNLDGKMALGFYTQKKEILDRNIAVHQAKEEEK